MFALLICLLSAGIPAAATSDLETLASEISKLGRKMDSFQSYIFEDILSIKGDIKTMNSKIDSMMKKDELAEETAKSSFGSKDQETSTVNDIIESMAVTKQLDRIKRGFKEEKEGLRRALDGLKSISQDLILSKDQITEYLVTLVKSTKTFLSDIHSELKDELVEMTTHVHSDLNTSIEHSAVKFDGSVQTLNELVERSDTICKTRSDAITDMLKTAIGAWDIKSNENVQTLNGLVERTDTICKTRSDTITETLKSAIDSSERHCAGYLHNASRNTAILIDVIKEDINTVMENTDYIVAHSNLTTSVRLANASKYLNGVQGRLEVLHDGVWGTVCDDGFGINSAKVACKMIDLKFTKYAYHDIAYFGRGSGTIWLDGVACNGNEHSLFICAGNPIGDNNCGHDEDVGITCW